MKFDIIITHIGSDKAKNIIARHLAHDPSISLQKALSMLQNPPVVYMTGVLKEDAQYHVRQLEKIQVRARLVEVQLAPLLPHTVPQFVPDHAAAPAPPPPGPAPRPSPPSIPPPHHSPGAVDAAGPQAGSPAAMTKMKIVILTSVAAALLILTIVILALKGSFNWGHAFALDWSKAGVISGDSASRKSDARKTKPDHGTGNSAVQKHDADTSRGTESAADADEASDEQKGRAEACVDSGKNAADISQAISFYQLAIAFNKRNVNAWYALHDTYIAAQMSKEADKTDTEMRRLFGDNIFSVAKIMEPFGAVTSTSLTRDGIYRVEYRTRESNPAKNLADSYLLVKALKNSCLCNAVSLYARTSAGKGMLVYIRTDSFPASFDEYKASANITYLK